MTKKEKAATQAHELVKRILSDTFRQKLDPHTLSEVAEKVSQTVPANWPRKEDEDEDGNDLRVA